MYSYAVKSGPVPGVTAQRLDSQSLKIEWQVPEALGIEHAMGILEYRVQYHRVDISWAPIEQVSKSRYFVFEK